MSEIDRGRYSKMLLELCLYIFCLKLTTKKRKIDRGERNYRKREKDSKK